MENIYNLIPTLKNRVEMFTNKKRYLIVCFYNNKPAYFFDLVDEYSSYLFDIGDFEFIIAYRKSGKIISYIYTIKKLNDINKFAEGS